jgi:signal transduction histidine kinase
MKLTPKICFSAFLFLVLQPFLGNAQTYNSVIYYQGQAPASSKVYSMAQDADGNMWYLTQQGISVYNGSQWVTFPDTVGLPREENSKLFALPDGSMWVFGYNYTSNVLFRYADGKWAEFPSPGGWDPMVFLSSDISWHNGQVRIAVGQLGRIDFFDKTWQRYHLPTQEYIYKLAFRGDSLLAVTAKEIYVFRKGGEWQPLLEGNLQRQLPPGKLYNFLYSPSGDTLFLLSNKWLGMATKGDFTLLADGLVPRRDTDMLASNLLYYNTTHLLFSIASLPYLYNLQDKKATPLTSNYFDEFTWVHHCFLDLQHNLWIGGERGVVKMNSLRFKNFEFNMDRFQNSEVSAIAQLDSQTVLLGGNFGYTLYNRAEERFAPFVFDIPLGKQHLGRVLDIALDDQGSIYLAASEAGLVKLDAQGHMVGQEFFEKVNTLLWHKGRLYFAFGYDNVGVMENGKLTKLKLKNDRFYIRKIHIGQNGRLLLLSAAGLMEVSLDLEIYNPIALGKSAMHNVYSRHLYEGKELFGTLGGLCFLEEGGFRPAEIYGHTLDRPVYSLLTDRRGRLWAGTDRGVFIFEKGKPLLKYDLTDGLKGSECNRNALIEDANGNIWIGTDRGLSVYDARMDNGQIPPPILSLDKVEINEQTPLPIGEPMQLGHQQPVAFYFSAASFYDEQSVIYRFRLKGLEEEWRQTAQNRENSVRYAILPAGEYEFEVQAKEANSDWSNLASSGPIKVSPPFYLTWWFVLAAIACFLLFGFVANALVTFKTNEIRLKRTIVEKVNAIRKTEHKLRLQNRELTKVNKELDSFVYSVSHDLRSPISSTLGLVNLLKAEKDQETQAYYLSLVETSLQRLDSFIQDIIDLSRNARLEVEVEAIDLPKLIEDIFHQQKYSDETSKMQLLLEHQGERVIHSDRKRLQVVFNNLISNAIKYRNSYIDNPFVEVKINLGGHLAEVEVHDNGIGIQEDRLPRIFEMFYRATDHRKGSGLGLYIVKETLEKLGGEIEVASVAGKGATFRVKLMHKASQT